MIPSVRRGVLRTFVRLQPSAQRPTATTNGSGHVHSSSVSSTRHTSTTRPPESVSPVVKTLVHGVRASKSPRNLTDLVSIDQVKDHLESIVLGHSTDVIAVRRLLHRAKLDGLNLKSLLVSRLLFIAELISWSVKKQSFDRRGSAEIVRTASLKGDGQFDKCMAVLETWHKINSLLFPDTPVILRTKSLPCLVSLALRTGYHYELFESMLKYKMDVTLPALQPIRYKLRKGTPRERNLYEWSSLFEERDVASQKAKMMEFVMSYSPDMIRQILLSHLKQGNQLQSSRYLELYIARYAMEKSTRKSKFEMKKSTVELYEMIGYVAVRLWNYQSVIGVLETMKANNIPLTRNFYTILLASMRKKKQYEAGLMLLRQLPSLFPDPDPMFQSVIANELISFIRSRFPTDVRVVLAHFLAIYPNSSNLVNKLGIPGVIYNKKVETMKTFKDKVAVANLDKYFQYDTTPSNFTLSEIYKSLFVYLHLHGESTAANLILLFNRYLVEYRNTPEGTHTDSIIFDQFITHAIQQLRSPKTAFYMLSEFLKNGPPKIWNKQIITYVFYHHGCRAGSEKFVQFTDLMAKYQVVPDFNLLAGLSKKDQAQGELWYNRLKEMGFSVNVPSLQERASFLGWDKDDKNAAASQEPQQKEQMADEWEEDAEIWDEEDDGSEFVSRFEIALKGLDLWKDSN